ncbi:DUF433 domain-containing protein [candidate division CSSED10-310 bacterium]|uniref:DUF433 domain-containing protein n=1 Tax=candidate division CSSED10-310 bacterium TaxID=2855610 RepID=A0ABV6YYE4_UNCC1
MEIEDYFEFLSQDDIRIKGTRIGIETILEDYFEGISPEEIAIRYRNLTLEQIYATITYYLRNRATIDTYLNSYRQHTDHACLKQDDHSSKLLERLRHLKANSLERFTL